MVDTGSSTAKLMGLDVVHVLFHCGLVTSSLSLVAHSSWLESSPSVYKIILVVRILHALY